jgi:signal transduction histidine kinase/HAMP domain-containing protein
MKLFQRTLLSFAGAIFLQALLAGTALAAIFGSMQSEDAAKELKSEAESAYGAFNAWKLAFWKDITELADDGRLSRLVEGSRSSPLDSFPVMESLRQRLVGSGAESVYIEDRTRGAGRFLYRDPHDSYAPDSSVLACGRPHPYIEIVSTAGGIWFTGVVRIAPRARRPLDVFLLKRIDENLVSHLSYDPMVAVVVSDGTMNVVRGNSGSAAGARGVMESADDFLALLKSRQLDISYVRFPRREGPAGGYAAVAQQSGPVTTPDGPKSLILSTVLSYRLYEERAARINGAVLTVSLIAAALTIAVALALARSIVDPVRRLTTAMRRMEKGDYGAEVLGRAGGEIGELLEGFNLMARKLEADKSELEAYIEEIEGLQLYRERVIDAIREGLAVVDAGGAIEGFNRAFAELFSPAPAGSPALGATDAALFDRELLGMVRDIALDPAAAGATLRRSSSGRTFDVKLYPLGAVPRQARGRCIVIVEDVSDRLAAEARMIQADRLASMSMLSAGVAHEINNPLSSILSNVQNLMSEMPGGESGEALRIVERETRRIARIVRQLLDFSAPRYPGAARFEYPPRCSPSTVIADLVILVGYPFRAEGSVRIVQDIAADCPDAAITEDELKQVLLNLIKNALESIDGRGKIVVRAAAVPEGVELSVTDSGPGIPEEALGRIFDPFFTTKEHNGGEPAGIGLGLSVVYGIVTTRGGRITAENDSTGQGGAVLRVVLPAAAEAQGGMT